MKQGFEKNQFFEKYKYHFLVFLAALFVAITFAHPQIFVTDEWITVNQLAQIHAGHQVLINEGKYGFIDAGSPSKYFILRNNLLGYTIFLPLLSMPAYWLIDVMGSAYVYGILIIWTSLLFIIGFLIKYYMNDPRIFGNWRLSSVLFVISFVLFFINLLYYVPFPVTGKNPWAEFLAIVSTNCLFYAILTVIIYCILLEIFADINYSLFGTFICISGSSYLVWVTCLKDHMLVALLYGALVLSIVYYIKRHDRWFFPVSCIIIGLIAWARPELALPTFIGTVAFYWFTYHAIISHKKSMKDIFFTICSPFFVFIGALPFFINNYFITKNPFLPTWAVWPIMNSSSYEMNFTPSTSYSSGLGSPVERITQMIVSDMAIGPDTFLRDIYGVLINPQNGSMGVLALTPIFLISLFLLPIIFFTKNLTFSKEEKLLLFSMGLFSFLVFAAYLYQLTGLNTSLGSSPDIRYLSPVYLSLNIFGLIVLKKIPEIPKISGNTLRLLLFALVILIPLIIIFNAHYYPDPDISWSSIFLTLDIITSLTTYLLILIFLLLYLSIIIYKEPSANWLLAILLVIVSIPLIWQIITSFNIWDWGRGLGGYTYWIPIVRKFCQL